MPKNRIHLTLAALVDRFRDAAARRGRALLTSDSKAANSAFDETARVWAELSRRQRVHELAPLLLDQDDGVRLSAASRLLHILPDQAEAVLRDLGNQDSLIGLSAAATLEAKRRYGTTESAGGPATNGFSRLN